MNTELIRELRTLTSAGMSDCKSALVEADWDLQKAIDIVKIKGQNIADGRTSKITSEGKVFMAGLGNKQKAMIEINSQTDFVANSEQFMEFGSTTAQLLLNEVSNGQDFDVASVENLRKELVASAKENIVIRRWWVEEAGDPSVRVFGYSHSGKIGVLLTMKAGDEAYANSQEFHALGNDLAMQVCAMNPIAVSSDRVLPGDLDRQKDIIKAQMSEDKKPKPEAMVAKILEGKMARWFKDVCLLNQESVLHPKKMIKDLLPDGVVVINFVRAQVGEGIEKTVVDLAKEVAEMTK